ncbi:MAG TPA: lipocalin-like domain-containing protein [Burkholderiales bacterium]|nr:lipocalin-like domain-containing protein [Burkholderiales bacterium]
MNKSIAAGFAVLLLFGASQAWAQQRGPISKKLLIGNWTYVSAQSVAKDGTKFPLVEGANPKGLLTFDGVRFSQQIISEFPKLASNDRLKTTPEENKAVAHGVLSYYGTYSLSEADGVLTLNIERSSFPNQNGASFKRVIKTLTAEDLVYINPSTLAGRVNTNVWKRVR